MSFGTYLFTGRGVGVQIFSHPLQRTGIFASYKRNEKGIVSSSKHQMG